MDLRNHGWLIHINQWGSSDKNYRAAVDEQVIPPQKIGEAQHLELLQAFKANKLTPIPTRGVFNYYINFNGGSTGLDIKKQVDKYILLSIKGQMFFTDGTLVWDEQAYDNVADVALRQPVRWRKLPDDAFIITN